METPINVCYKHSPGPGLERARLTPELPSAMLWPAHSMELWTEAWSKHEYRNQRSYKVLFFKPITIKIGMLVASPQHAHLKNGIFFPFSAAQNDLSTLRCLPLHLFCSYIEWWQLLSTGRLRKESVSPEQHMLISNTRNDQRCNSFSFQRKYSIFRTTLMKEKTQGSND